MCRVHIIVIKDEEHSRSQTELEELLKLFEDAKIKDEIDYVAELMKSHQGLRLNRIIYELHPAAGKKAALILKAKKSNLKTLNSFLN